MTPFEEMALIEEKVRSERQYRNFAEFSSALAEERADQLLACWFEQSKQLTYLELEKKSSALAHSLQSLGVRKGTHVGLLVNNGPEGPITWFALAKLGAASVPINTNYTTSEISQIIRNGDVDWLVTKDGFLDRLAASSGDAPVIAPDRTIAIGSESPPSSLNWRELADAGDSGFEAPYEIGGDSLLNIQFTSGTTGMPKGCMLSQSYWILISQLCFWRMPEADVRRSLIWPPFHYLDGQRKFVEQMRAGVTMYIPQKLRLTKLLDWIWEHSIEYAAVPEPLLKMIPKTARDKDIPLRFADCYGWTGEKRRLFEERFNATIRDTYGMTEVGVQTFLPISAYEKSWTPTCGLLAPFCELKIVDDHENEVPDGVIGELWASGKGLMQGYYRRPDANRQSFVGKWFRTGDLFYRTPDGYYYFQGRIKDMVKRSGENISAVEVETVAKLHAAVTEVAVIGVPDELRGEEVKMFLRLAEDAGDAQSTITELNAHLGAQLAHFKCPRYYAVVSDFPRTSVGKIEKRSLREGHYETIFEIDMKAK